MLLTISPEAQVHSRYEYPSEADNKVVPLARAAEDRLRSISLPASRARWALGEPRGAGSHTTAVTFQEYSSKH